jgi:pilus assembly protein Flp/PilA
MKRAIKNKSGATAIEYGLVMGIAALLILTAVTQMGQKTSSSFNKVASAMN